MRVRLEISFALGAFWGVLAGIAGANWKVALAIAALGTLTVLCGISIWGLNKLDR